MISACSSGSVVVYLLMPERVKALESKVDAMAADLSDFLKTFRDSHGGNIKQGRSETVSYVA